jgi:acetyl-CoA carboxylase biotin carboxyl carrier protein
MTDVARPADLLEPVLAAIRDNAADRRHPALPLPVRVRIESGGVAVEVEWPPAELAAVATLAPAAVRRELPAAPVAPAIDPGPAPAPLPDSGEFTVRSPSVGVFYHAPSAGAPPFVAVGDRVEAGQQVGIVEVMKLMMPINADTSGEVVRLLVADATPVEYDQQLIVCAGAVRQ